LGGWVSILSLWQFPDVRAALAVSLYAQGLTAEAETNWLRMEVDFYALLALYEASVSNSFYWVWCTFIKDQKKDVNNMDVCSPALIKRSVDCVQDGRYRDRNWVRQTRRWPPRLVSELEAFLDLKSVVSS